MQAGKKALYDDMTGLGLVFYHLAQVSGAAFQNNLSWMELLEHEREVRRIAGIGLSHPFRKSPLIPFIETFLAEFKTWMSEKKNEARLVRFAKVLNGEESEEYEFEYHMDEVANLKSAPAWFTQVLEAGGKRLEGSADGSVTDEKIGALIRNIPGDTTLGILAHSFLRELSKRLPDTDKARSLWLLLKGEKSLHCRAKVKGLFVDLKYNAEAG